MIIVAINLIEMFLVISFFDLFVEKFDSKIALFNKIAGTLKYFEFWIFILLFGFAA